MNKFIFSGEIPSETNARCFRTFGDAMKRTTVVILVILLSSAITLVTEAQKYLKYTVLAIEYIGPKDHLIGPIVISDSKKGAEWFSKAILKKSIAWDYTPEFLVSASMMKSLSSETEVHRGIAQRELSAAPETTMTVRVTLVTPQGQSKFLTNHKLAYSMSDSFKGLSKDNQPLQSEISQFQEELHP